VYKNLTSYYLGRGKEEKPAENGPLAKEEPDLGYLKFAVGVAKGKRVSSKFSQARKKRGETPTAG